MDPDQAACRGRSELFFGPPNERPPARARREAEARRLCASCPIVEGCRSRARTGREFGLWGGETEVERSDAGFAPSAPRLDMRTGGRGRPDLGGREPVQVG